MKTKILIGIDCTGLNKGWENTGLGLYLKHLIEGLIINKDNYKIVLFAKDIIKDDFCNFFPEADEIIYIKKLKIKKIGTLFLRNLQLAILVRKYKINVMINPYTELGALLFCPCKAIAVVHDLHFKYYPEFYSFFKRILIKWWIGKIINNYSNIIAISNYTKRDIVEIYNKNERNIKVIGNPVELKDYCEDNNDIKKIILSVNSFMKWKNQKTLVKAFYEIKDIIPYNLVLIGTGNSSYIKKLVSEMKIENRVFVKQHLTDREMSFYYKTAKLFVNTSLFEGFGRSNIEAGLMMLPVLSSEEMCLREVSFSMLEYYKPATDFKVLANRILECLNKNVYNEERLTKIKDKFEFEYNKRNIAKKYLNLIDEMIK